jgi:hypothetical protein
MIAGELDEKNEKDAEVSFFVYILFFLIMWKTIKDNKNGFVCLV